MSSATLDVGMQVAFSFFALGVLLLFSVGVLFGFVDWVRRFVG